MADLGCVVDKPPTDRMFAPELGGGALLDMGIYPLTFAQLFLGEPAELTAVGAPRRDPESTSTWSLAARLRERRAWPRSPPA